MRKKVDTHNPISRERGNFSWPVESEDVGGRNGVTAMLAVGGSKPLGLVGDNAFSGMDLRAFSSSENQT